MKKKTMVLIIVLLAIAGLIVYLESQKATSPSPATQSGDAQTTGTLGEPTDVKDGKYPLAPELQGISGYLNTEEGLQIEDLRGKVVLIDFWTYTCINCIRTLPYLTSWDEKYRDEGLVIIGVHTPEFEFEKEKENVRMAIEKYGIKYPVVQDNDYATWRAYQNRFWPRKYLIDKDGYIRYDHIGEGAYEETEQVIQELLAENGAKVDEELTPEAVSSRVRTTAELYAGYEFAIPRGQTLGNQGGFHSGQTFDYVLPQEIPPDLITLQGEWRSDKESLVAQEDGAAILLNFVANSVNIVAMPESGQEELVMTVKIDDVLISEEQAGSDVSVDQGSTVLVNQPRLYNVVDGEYGRYILRLEVKEGFSFSAFTFG